MDKARIETIGLAVDEWNWKEKELKPEKYPGEDLPLNDSTEELDKELFLRAAKEMGVTPEELREWLAATARELAEGNLLDQNLDDDDDEEEEDWSLFPDDDEDEEDDDEDEGKKDRPLDEDDEEG